MPVARNTSPLCAADGCGRRAIARGYCDRHYRRVLHGGSVDVGRVDRDVDEQRSRLGRGLAEIDNPVALAGSYLARRRLLGGPDEADLFDVAIEAIVDAAIAWEPDGGRSMTSWAWVYMDRNVTRELARCVERRHQLGEHACVTDGSWMRYDPGTDPYNRVELRVDLQRWADLAELTPLMRWLVEYAALHLGTVVRYTVFERAPSPFKDSTHTTFKLALSHMRRAAVTGQRRDDAWTRMRNRAERDAIAAGALARLRRAEDERAGLAAVHNAGLEEAG